MKFLYVIIILGILSAIGEGLIGVIPVFFPFIFFLMIFNVFKKKDVQKAPSRVQYGNKTTTARPSNRDRNRIDKKLRNYFQNHTKLTIADLVALQPKGGQYTVLEDLYITYNDELIITMSDFQKRYPSVYDTVYKLLITFSKQKDEVLEAEVKVTDKPKAEAKLSSAQQYIDKINLLNNDIPNEEVKNGLYQTTALLKQIELGADAEDEKKLTKLYDYYLPILVDVLEKYKNLAKVALNSDDFKKNEMQLIKTIILINEALKELNITIHEDDNMNLSADLQTLQSLLKKDGLVNDDLKKGKQNG